MRTALLERLRCPFCGGRCRLYGDEGQIADTHITHGVLGCACCAYPIVDGIPILKTNDAVSEAIRAIERGDIDDARARVTDLPPERSTLLTASFATFADAAMALLPDGEGHYYVRRFGDPTFVVADALVRAVSAGVRRETMSLPFVDVCAGCGHLTRTLESLRTDDTPPTIAIDASFWRLHLLTRFLAPHADVICADANLSLPLASRSVALTACNDAFSYIWHKRTLATELDRITTARGAVVLTHLHSALGINATAGNTLLPTAYAALVDRPSRLLDDDQVRASAVMAGTVALGTGLVEDAGPDVVSVVASHVGDVFTTHPLMFAPLVDQPQINPLYDVQDAGEALLLRLQFPSTDYAEEFGAVTAYLPDTLRLPRECLDPARWNTPDVLSLRQRRVLLDLPVTHGR